MDQPRRKRRRLDADGSEDEAAALHAAVAPALVPSWTDADDGHIFVDLSNAGGRLRKLRAKADQTRMKGTEFSGRLRLHFERVHGTPSWATVSVEDGKPLLDIVEALSSRRAPISTTRILDSGAARGAAHLRVRRLADVVADNSSAVSSIEFSPCGTELLAGCMDKTLRIFSVDGVANPRRLAVHLQDLPVRSAAYFSPPSSSSSASHILATGRRRFMYKVDAETGAARKVACVRGRDERSWESFAVDPTGAVCALVGMDGSIPLVSLETFQVLSTLKITGTVRALAFSRLGRHLFAYGGDGTLFVFDVATHQCIVRMRDEGSFSGTSLAVSETHLACGSSSGVVNLYLLRDVLVNAEPAAAASASAPETAARAYPKPYAVVDNLVTSISGLCFSPDGTMMVAFSGSKVDALRVVHVHTGAVFANWPTARTPLKRVTDAAFSPDSNRLAIANDSGRVLLYQLHEGDGADRL